VIHAQDKNINKFNLFALMKCMLGGKSFVLQLQGQSSNFLKSGCKINNGHYLLELFPSALDSDRSIDSRLEGGLTSLGSFTSPSPSNSVASSSDIIACLFPKASTQNKKFY
jgi:hypothetical protein